MLSFATVLEEYQNFIDAVSPLRMSRYVKAYDGDIKKAVLLYKANIRLAQKVFSIISILEIILRNAIDVRYKKHFGSDDWICQSIEEGGFLTKPESEKQKEGILEVIEKLEKIKEDNPNFSYSHNNIVTELTLGFWVRLFAPLQFQSGGNVLLEILPNRPLKVNQDKVYSHLAQINRIRNRIAHHEPICFKKDQISTKSAEEKYQFILDLLSWLGYDPTTLLRDVDQVQSEIDYINKL